jgi:uroporphyrinogen decarboxylase
MEGLPDRVPLQFDLCKQLIEHFSKKYDIPVDITDNIFEDVTWRISANELRLKMGCDTVIVGASHPEGWKPRYDDKGAWLNEYMMNMHQGKIYVEVTGNPLADAESVEEIDDYDFPDPYAKGRYTKAEELISKYKKDYVIIGNIEVTIFQLAQQLLGMEKFFCDMQLEEEYIDRLLVRCAEFQTAVGLELIKRGVDVIWSSDDFGSQKNLLISPAIFRKYIKPKYIKMNNTFKKANPDIILALHSDGAVRPLLQDFVEMGFDIFNPVQPGVPGHSPKELKEAIGGELVFWGAIDQQDLLANGTDDELKKDIIEKISVLGSDGGYMISPAHIIQSDVSPDRVEKFIELCIEYGGICSKA